MNKKINSHSLESEKEVLKNSSLKLFEVITKQLRLKRRVLIFLSGGSVVQMYPNLTAFIKKNDILLKDRLAFAQVDERFRPEGSKKAQSPKPKAQKYNLKLKNNINSELIKETGLWDICKDKKIPYFLISQTGTLKVAASEYNQTLERLFKECDYKIAVLGIGEDGHTAGLIPGYSDLWDKSQYSVGYELNRKQDIWARISLTPFALNKMDYALVVTLGEQKEKALKIILEEKNLKLFNDYPAVLIQRIKAVDLFTNLKIP